VKLQVTQENLTRALNNVARVASTKNALPILSNVLIKTVDNRVIIAATNLNIAITHYIGSKVSQEGSITVPARLMQDFVASLPSGVIDIKVEDTKLRIKADKYNSTINGTLADDYPVMPKIQDGTSWTLSGGDLKRALQQVVLAASHDDARPILTGIYFHTHDGELYIAATDSYRLAEKRVMKLNQEVNLLIPASAMQDLLRIIGDYEEEITVTHDDQQVLFTVGDIELVTRLIDGKYPDYRKLIPSSFSTSAKLPKNELVNITKVSSLFARESAGSVTLDLDEDEKQISIRSIASQLGENTATATADVTGAASITLNSRYILDALGVINDQDVSLAFNGKLEPCVLHGTEDKDYLHLIMPLKS
jgi:DNA polymerase III subunit beta